ncbi:MAG: endonuclease III [Clostridiales bacterium]|jgi:endonuclease-3|nr:endonuclease III [Clostridiales bacterium]
MKRLPKNRIPEVMGILEGMHPEAMCALDHRSSYELLVAVVLSAQTTDVSVNKVTPELFRKYPDPASLAAADQADVMDTIKTIGLYRNKSANIIKLAQKLTEDYDGIVPSDFNELVKLPGVGRKTANVVMAEAFGKPAIAVDTHVFRVANRIGLTDADDVNKTEDQLKERLPEDQWIRAHHLLIFHGRKVCHARKPDCEACGLNEICLGVKK